MKIAFIIFIIFMTVFSFSIKFIKIGNLKYFLEKNMPIKLAHICFHAVGGIILSLYALYLVAVLIALSKIFEVI